MALFAFLCLQNASATDAPESKRLEERLDKATTQVDMNEKAGELARHWDSRLAGVEKKLEEKMNKSERREFRRSKKRWRTYRSKEVALRTNFFEGGSIQPLIAEGAYSEITEHRVPRVSSRISGIERDYPVSDSSPLRRFSCRAGFSYPQFAFRLGRILQRR